MTDENRGESKTSAVRDQMKVVEVITPAGSIDKSLWSGQFVTSTTGATSKKKELAVKPSFTVIYGTNERGLTAVINVAKKSIPGGVRVIWGASELEVAARTFEQDYNSEVRPWLVCLSSLDKKMIQLGVGETKGLEREWKEFYASPIELLTDEMLAAITSVVFFGYEWLNIKCLAKIMFEAYGNKFESLELFTSTVKRILDYPDTFAMEVLPGKPDESCIVRRLK